MKIKKILLLLALVLVGLTNFGKVYASEEKVLEENYIVKEVNKEGVDVYKKGNPIDLYQVPKDKFPQEVKEGEEYTIKHNDIIMPSNPAQFNKIFEIKNVHQASKQKSSLRYLLGAVLLIILAGIFYKKKNTN